ncbi:MULTISPECIES: transposase [unclassified Bradyrhizobium]|uniref:IS66 family insertion sequence element accessory protein TnpA n=1 Tax=unclassified Bradyrhizobium TaxID=2631580 RepID=UPI0024784E63|nr:MULTISPECIES: transposase [unclassified Bradyrhizobium]WGR70313.1 transposase [Bradyrhizobium sp. ISRA426]WGR82372.1 transposase [Bradyrhizobium sp. ISRA430]WGR85558.1 transposase [Bradyrhizobium sp. ISRA432]
MGPKHFQNKARREWWSIHIEAWQRSGLSQRAYCRRHRLDQGTFARWLKALAGEEAARKLAKYQTELRREELKGGPRRTLRQRFSISTDVRHRGLQAFWAMHVEAMNWSGMGARECAAALSLSPYALRKWRHRLDAGKLEIDWRAHLHPSARPVASTSAKESTSQSSLTDASNDAPTIPATRARRFFSDEQKLAIVMETEQPGTTVSGVARKHGIVTGLLFRWRVEFGFAQRKRAKCASVALADDTTAALVLRPPEGMMAIGLPDGRCVFAPIGSDPDVVRARVESGEIAPC